MDRHRNDRLELWRRKILRRCSGPDTDANIFSKPNRDSKRNCNGYGDINTHSHRYTYSNTESYTYTTATPHTGASAVNVTFFPWLLDYKK